MPAHDIEFWDWPIPRKRDPRVPLVSAEASWRAAVTVRARGDAAKADRLAAEGDALYERYLDEAAERRLAQLARPSD